MKSEKQNKIKKPTKQELTQAYDLVIADLFSLFKKAPSGAKIKLGELGTFSKKQAEITTALNGKTYLYYRLSFQASSFLKKELDK